ncbi:MAG TPA: T9SS type A sorting domain-containing protein, partial [Rhodothermales bacterium]|nr:T9SS type A sorting domain-containing protein [Rhodothermales bacterium]
PSMKVPYSLRLVAAAFLVLLALPVSAQEFSNTDYIYSRAQTVTQGPALLYPAPLAVSTVPGNVTDLDVRINTLLHTWPDDLDMLLVAPDGTNMIIMSDAGGEADIANVTITLDDEAATQLSDDGPLVTGSFRPLNSGAGDSFAAPAPAPNLANVTLAAFDGVVANGTWNLYIMDDASGDYGSLVTGWALIINGTTINSATARPVPAHVTSIGAGDPYPSTINVSGLPTTGILDVNVRLDSLGHSFPDDIDLLLVGPNGTNIILASDVGGINDVAGVVLTIDDEAASLLPDGTALVSGSFRPTNIGTGDTFTAPAPAPSGNTSLTVFDALNPNGTWSLFIMDDLTADQGAISGGWSLIFTTTPTASEGPGSLPTAFALYTPSPNPIVGKSALVQYDLPEAATARIEVYDMLGRRVAVVADGAEEAGRHTARLDVSALASGSYVVRMTAGSFVQAQRVTVTR